MYDLRSMHGTTEELWFPQWDLKGRPWDSPLYEKFSPSTAVKNFKMPALVITGERDYRVPYTQSLQFFTDLQEMKVPSRLIVYPNAGHWPNWYEMVSQKRGIRQGREADGCGARRVDRSKVSGSG